MKQISTNQFKYALGEIQKNSNRKFCFILGAGASKSAGIRTGGELASEWYNYIQEKILSKDEFQSWKEESKIDEKDLASSYGIIYQKRFYTDKTSGYDYLINEMKDAKPGFGHFVLAQLLSRYSGHCVITTNFDSLMETAIYQYTEKTPLVCGHEALSGYARPSRIHPLIIKIHRDLLLSPMSTSEEIAALDERWEDPLNSIFQTHIPIFIGYGGNDGSLMSFLVQCRKPSNLFWCTRDIKEIHPKIQEVIERNEGACVEIEGFDELMYELLSEFAEIKPTTTDLEDMLKTRNMAIEEEFQRIKNKKAESKENTSTDEQKISAYEYGEMAENEMDYEKRKTIYEEALKRYPDIGWLWWEYTYFLHTIKKDYKDLENYYQRALKLNPDEGGIIGNYANFLKDIQKDYDKAGQYYKKALELDPNNANNTGNYATFLHLIQKDYDKAEQYYKKALELDSNSAIRNGNYALFLQNIRKEYDKAEEYYKKALELDPNNANSNGNYALFLQNIRKEYDKAEQYYKKSLELDPNNANNTGNYAVFLNDIRKDYDNAERYYKKALELEPNKATINGNYAVFLNDIRKDYDNAERYYEKALESDPNHANNNGKYAVFLNDIRKDYDRAEIYYKKTLELDPNDANLLGNYAVFLNDIRKDYDKAEIYYKKVIELDSIHSNNNANYAQLLLIQNKIEEARNHLQTALENNEIENGMNVEVWYYYYAHYPEYSEEAEEKIEQLLSRGIQSIGWNFEENIKTAIANGHPNPDKLRELATRITTTVEK